MENLIVLVAQRLSFGSPPEEIREMLLKEGLSEYDAYLVYKGAQVYLKTGAGGEDAE
jgi:hypothetical protein